MEWLALNPIALGGLSESVITTVWLGAMVVILFNLFWGWSLSGLIVPGYLVPLLILKPITVAVIVGEGLLTYALAQLHHRPAPTLLLRCTGPLSSHDRTGTSTQTGHGRSGQTW